MRSRALKQGAVQSTEQLSETKEVIPHPGKSQHPERNLALLKQFLRGKRFLLDCRHFSTPCHNLGSTIIILPNRIPEIICFNCYL